MARFESIELMARPRIPKEHPTRRTDSPHPNPLPLPLPEPIRVPQPVSPSTPVPTKV